MVGATGLRAGVSGAVAAAGLSLALWSLAVQPAEARQTAAREPTLAEAMAPPVDLIGPWLRNEELSEAPSLNGEGIGQGPELAGGFVSNLAGSLGDRLDAILIQVDGETLLLLNGKGELSSFRLGRERYTDRLGNEIRLLTASGGFRIETRISGWLWVETFSRKDDRLVRVTEIRHTGFSGLELRTVYDPVGTEHPSAVPSVGGPPTVSQPIRIVPPGRRGELLGSRVEVQTLVADPAVSRVEFTVDDVRTRVDRKPPFGARLDLAKPPREQTVDVKAYDADGEYLGADRIVLNRIDVAFAVRVTGIRRERVDGRESVQVQAGVSIPRSAALERVDFFLNDRPVAAVKDFGEPDASAARLVPVNASIRDVRVSGNDFVRVSARLADGRELEDAELLQGADYRGEVDVQLVQIQVLVADHQGNPVGDLQSSDFAIIENGRPRRVESVHTAKDVPLVLGLAIDSSDSMLPIWRKLRQIVASFLDRSLASGDRAFLVDFDATVRLLQPLTGVKSLLSQGLDRLTPLGGTALNDGVLFSLLQYRREAGRRALVVITDGADLHSRSRPRQSADFAERLGIPIYFLELDNLITRVAVGGGIGPSGDLTRLKQREARKRLDRISRRTGGRLFHIPPLAEGSARSERIEQVFDQIEEDLRHQHVLTYYSEESPGAAVAREVRVNRRGLKLRSAVPLE